MEWPQRIFAVYIGTRTSLFINIPRSQFADFKTRFPVHVYLIEYWDTHRFYRVMKFETVFDGIVEPMHRPEHVLCVTFKSRVESDLVSYRDQLIEDFR